MMAILFLGLAACLLSACNDEMDVQQSYPFKVETLPVPTRIVKGETVEISDVLFHVLDYLDLLGMEVELSLYGRDFYLFPFGGR